MNKYARTPLLAVAATLIFAGSAHAAQLEMNGGFETGDFTGWTVFENGGTVSISGDNPSSGTYSAHLTSAAGPFNPLIKNANIGIGTVMAGQEVTISFDMRGTTQIGGVVFAELFSEIDGGGVSKAEILSGGPLFPNADPDVWTSFLFTAIAGPDVSGGITLQLAAICGADNSCLADVYFDNVSVSVSSIPVPAALWLFGSALGLLGFRKARKS